MKMLQVTGGPNGHACAIYSRAEECLDTFKSAQTPLSVKLLQVHGLPAASSQQMQNCSKHFGIGAGTHLRENASSS